MVAELYRCVLIMQIAEHLFVNMNLQREEELLSSWWKEYAECSEGPWERTSSNKKSDIQPNASTSDCTRSAELYEVEERVGVPVKGGLYEVFYFSNSLIFTILLFVLLLSGLVHCIIECCFPL